MWPSVGEQNTPQMTRILSKKPFAKNVSSLLTIKIKVVMNDFPLIGDLVMRTGLWDRQGANIASRYKEEVVWAERFF